MDYRPITPFGRTLEAGQLQASLRHRDAETTPCPAIDKWQALRSLSAARELYGLSDRDLAVLQALISFHPETRLDPSAGAPVVYPSNASICERLNGMPCSTMRRHLGHLVAAGILLRRDSPNGKRYARRLAGTKVAYGFDLTPLAHRFAEFQDAADRLKARDARLRHLREIVSLMRRDLAALTEFGALEHPGAAPWDAYDDLARLTARALRRKLDEDKLTAIQTALNDALTAAQRALGLVKTEDLSSNDDQIEQHYQNSNKDSFESEKSNEDDPISSEDSPAPRDTQRKVVTSGTVVPLPKQRTPPLRMVLSVCAEFQSYSPEPIRDWPDMIAAAQRLYPMMGISTACWEEAVLKMGRDQASIALAAMLERFSEIRSPGAYLRHLAKMASEGRFSTGPMVTALCRKSAA
ncbi:replication initiation protein RepC [Salipiger sp. P9]|uniref:plasmid replication protein RepC n=1 Tax=Salipiger pentaromativorans TaxID=2943193 RepID=UPI00215863B6|nr:plasmid replication protein RepC [Salipiger pentaromativorans]MCR8549288.1 replication initiation protein RepC [Salipiger pentaromativorans]